MNHEVITEKWVELYKGIWEELNYGIYQKGK